MAKDDYNAAADAIGGISHEFNLSHGDLTELGQFATTLIVARTKQGIDVEGNPFTPYSKDYAALRQSKGLATQPDLARTGHMLGAIVPQIGEQEVTLAFLSRGDSIKAAAHNSGVDKQVSVRAHRRSTHVNAKGQRVSTIEAKRDKKRKNKRVFARDEMVNSHARRQRTPRREFFDVRRPEENAAIQGLLEGRVLERIEKRLNKR